MIAHHARASILDVARHARVSASTVSMVINSKAGISDPTRQRVLGICRKLDYQPHPTARFLPRLRGKQNGTVKTDLFAFTPVVDLERASSYTEFLSGVADVGAASHKTIIYQRLERNGSVHAPFLNRFGIDGRLLVGLVDDSVLEGFQSEKVPLVVMGDHQCRQPVWNVNLDCFAAGQMAVDYLCDLGHRRIALLCQARESGYQSEFRRGFETALRQRGVQSSSRFHKNAIPKGMDLLEAWFHKKEKPTAIVAIEGGAAQYAEKKLREMGLATPADVSLLAFARDPFAVTHEKVTCVDPGHEEIGRRAMEFLMRLAEQPTAAPSRTLIQPTLVEGKTCAHCGRGSTK